MSAGLILLGAARAQDACALEAAGLTTTASGTLAAALCPAPPEAGGAGARIAVAARAAAAARAFAPVRGGRFTLDAARAWLDAECDALCAALDRLDGCAEWVLTLATDAPQPDTAAQPQGGRAWLRALADRRRADAARLRRLESVAAHTLGEAARETRARSFDGPAGPGLDIAVLAPRAAEALVRKAAATLDAACTGPWPAFSFVALPQRPPA